MGLFSFFGSDEEDLAELAAQEQYEMQLASVMQTLDPEQAIRAQAFASARPNASPGLVASSAQAGINFDEFNNLADRDEGYDEDSSFFSGGDGITAGLDFLYRAISTPFSMAYEQVIKPAVRTLFLVGDTSVQELERFYGAGIAAVNEGFGVSGYEQDDDGFFSDFGDYYNTWGDSVGRNAFQALADGRGGKRFDLGTGFFVGGDVEIERQTEELGRVQVRGEAASLGRLVADPLTRFNGTSNEDWMYDFVSGSVDFTKQIAFDLSNYVSGGTAGIAKATGGAVGRGAKLLRFSDETAAAAAKSTREALTVQGTNFYRRQRTSFNQPKGLADGAIDTQGKQGAGQLLQRLNSATDEAAQDAIKLEMAGLVNSRARGSRGVLYDKARSMMGFKTLTQQIAEEKNPLRIINGFKSGGGNKVLDMDTFIQLADTTDELEIGRILAEKVAENYISDRRFYSGFKSKATSRIADSKFAGVAPTGFLNSQNLEVAAAKLDSMMRQANIGRGTLLKGADEAGLALRESIFRRVAAIKHGDPGANGELLEIVTDVMSAIVRNTQDALPEVKEESLKEVTRLYSNMMEDLRMFNVDELGHSVPGVHDRVLTSTTSSGAFSEVSVPGPHLLSEFNQMSVPLPDVREVRRIAETNALKRKVYETAGWDGFVRSATTFTGRVFKPMTLLRPAYIIRTQIDDQMRMAAAGIDSIWASPNDFRTAMLLDPDAALDLMGNNANSIRQAQTVLNHAMRSSMDGESMSDYARRAWRVISKPSIDEVDDARWATWKNAMRIEYAHIINDGAARHLLEKGMDVDALVRWFIKEKGLVGDEAVEVVQRAARQRRISEILNNRQGVAAAEKMGKAKRVAQFRSEQLERVGLPTTISDADLERPLAEMLDQLDPVRWPAARVSADLDSEEALDTLAALTEINGTVSVDRVIELFESNAYLSDDFVTDDMTPTILNLLHDLRASSDSINMDESNELTALINDALSVIHKSVDQMRVTGETLYTTVVQVGGRGNVPRTLTSLAVKAEGVLPTTEKVTEFLNYMGSNAGSFIDPLRFRYQLEGILDSEFADNLSPEELAQLSDELDTLAEQWHMWTEGGLEDQMDAQASLGPDVPSQIDTGGMLFLRENSLLAEYVDNAPAWDSVAADTGWDHFFRGEPWTLQRYLSAVERGEFEPGAYYDISRMSSASTNAEVPSIFTGSGEVAVYFRYEDGTRAMNLSASGGGGSNEWELLIPAQRMEVVSHHKTWDDPSMNPEMMADPEDYPYLGNLPEPYAPSMAVGDVLHEAGEQLPEGAFESLQNMFVEPDIDDDRVIQMFEKMDQWTRLDDREFIIEGVRLGIPFEDMHDFRAHLDYDGDLNAVEYTLEQYGEDIANGSMIRPEDVLDDPEYVVITLRPVNDAGDTLMNRIRSGDENNIPLELNSIDLEDVDAVRSLLPADASATEIAAMEYAAEQLIQVRKYLSDTSSGRTSSFETLFEEAQLSSNARTLLEAAPKSIDPQYMEGADYVINYKNHDDVGESLDKLTFDELRGLVGETLDTRPSFKKVAWRDKRVTQRMFKTSPTSDALTGNVIVEVPEGIKNLSLGEGIGITNKQTLRVVSVDHHLGKVKIRTELVSAKKPEMRPAPADAAGGADYLAAYARTAKGREGELLRQRDPEAVRRYAQSIHDRIMTKTGGNVAPMKALANGEAEGLNFFDKADDAKVGDYLREHAYEGAPGFIKAPVPRKDAMSERGKWDKTTDYLAEHIITKPANYLSRMPAWQQFMTQNVRELLPQMTVEMRTKAVEYAKENLRMSQRQADELDDVMRRIAGTPDGPLGDMTVINELVVEHATHQVSDLLFDVQNQSAFQQAFVNIFPFVDAFRESMETYTKLMYQRPDFFMKQASRLRASEESGFVYTNERGERVFANPMSTFMGEWVERAASDDANVITGAIGAAGATAKALAGNDEDLGGSRAKFESRLSGMNMMFNSIGPGFGPLVQWPLGAFAPNDPELQGINELINPYGAAFDKPGEFADVGSWVQAIAPSWAEKALNAISSGGIDEVQWNSMVSDQMQALVYSGKYDPTSAADKERLMRHAVRSARYMLLIRGVTQATFATGPEVNMELRTDGLNEDFERNPEWDYAADPDGTWHQIGALATEYYDLLDSYGDFETAAEKFRDAYGTEPAYLAQGRTAQMTSLDATVEAEFWIDSNRSFFGRYPTVAGYFAPADEGNEFNYKAWRNQLARGEREIITPEQQLNLANSARARQIYYTARRKLEAAGLKGQKLNNALFMIKGGLSEQFPGWEAAVGPVEKPPTDVVISQLQLAINDPSVRDSELTEPLMKYFALRTALLERARTEAGRPNATLKSNAADPYRQVLRRYGIMMSQQSGAFSGVWNVLRREVDA